MATYSFARLFYWLILASVSFVWCLPAKDREGCKMPAKLFQLQTDVNSVSIVPAGTIRSKDGEIGPLQPDTSSTTTASTSENTTTSSDTLGTILFHTPLWHRSGQTAVTSVTALESLSYSTELPSRADPGLVSTAKGARDDGPSEVFLSGATGPDSATSRLGETASGTLTTTSSSQAVDATRVPQLANSQPCNLYVEFCARRYSDITYVGAHNSPFVHKGSIAANQNFDVKVQLNDGIRMLQGQTHKVNDTVHYCHTRCDLFNAGPIVDYLRTVVEWLRKNPFEIVTILIGNGDFLNVRDYSEPLEKSGLAELAYIPEKQNMKINQWPTLSEMILAGKRAVVFMDYKADEGTIPYILDEFRYMWETPFSPTNENFPCTIHRPPDQPKNDTQGKLYMANHNLNTNLPILGNTVLIPNTVDIRQTNSVSGFRSLGLMANNCRADWDRYPNYLLVDFYDTPAGSVFEVAARVNNVTYDGSK